MIAELQSLITSIVAPHMHALLFLIAAIIWGVSFTAPAFRKDS